MSGGQTISEHWGKGDIYDTIHTAMLEAGIDPQSATVDQLSPVDHLHARGFPATVELGDALPVKKGDHLIDIGCGVGGPARYLADRFQCRVSGIDITEQFVIAAQKLTALVKMEDRVKIELGDGNRLPFGDAEFDGGYAQHVTMNISDRDKFFAEAFRVIKPGGFFALTEHGMGPAGNPHYPVPWSDDGSGSYLISPDETVERLEKAGFENIQVEHTGPKYVAGYKRMIELAADGQLPPFGTHIIIGASAPAKSANAARNIEEGRTDPIQVVCYKRK